MTRPLLQRGRRSNAGNGSVVELGLRDEPPPWLPSCHRDVAEALEPEQAVSEVRRGIGLGLEHLVGAITPPSTTSRTVAATGGRGRLRPQGYPVRGRGRKPRRAASLVVAGDASGLPDKSAVEELVARVLQDAHASGDGVPDGGRAPGAVGRHGIAGRAQGLAVAEPWGPMRPQVGDQRGSHRAFPPSPTPLLSGERGFIDVDALCEQRRAGRHHRSPNRPTKPSAASSRQWR